MRTHAEPEAQVRHACAAAGIIQGEVRVSGHPKVQGTFARVTGYVEQSDIHSPNVRLVLCFVLFALAAIRKDSAL